MEKFRVISDIHLDINSKYLFEINDDIFTVICGDTAGSTSKTIEWINKNIKFGIGVSGNHLVYNDENCTIQELRCKLAKAFPIDNSFTYLDTEVGCYKKIVDGIMFLGSCFYSNMEIKPKMYPDFDVNDNKLRSFRYMNDYKWAIKEKRYDFGTDNAPTEIHVNPSDYVEWSNNALKAFDEALCENESKADPLPVVIVTHYPLVKDVIANSFYVDEDNWASYGNDLEEWLKKHKSIRCHCCGHCHDIAKSHRSFPIYRVDGSKVLIVNNSRGYVDRCHDMTFNVNRFVNVKTWEIEEESISKKELSKKEKRYNDFIKIASCFI